MPTIASSIPSSPAHTPRRAVLGELIHLSERTKRAVAIRYATSITMFVGGSSCQCLLGPLALNILSIRSVMMNPPTTLLVAAMIAIVPNTVASVLLRSPARMIAPTTAIASSALVSDIKRRVQQGRNAPDHFKADKCRQHEYVKAGNQVKLHAVYPLGLCRQGGEREKLADAGIHDLAAARQAAFRG